MMGPVFYRAHSFKPYFDSIVIIILNVLLDILFELIDFTLFVKDRIVQI